MNRTTLRRSQREIEQSAQELTAELAVLNGALVGNTTELELSEQRFQCHVRATSQILWTTNPDGRMEGIQSEWSTFTGQTPDEYHEFGWLTAVHPDDAETTRAAWTKAVTERRPFLFEHRARRRDGIYRLFTISGVPVLDDEGAICKWVGVHNDITDHRRREEEILEQEAKFRFLSESMPQMVWTARRDGWRDYHNQRWFDYTGTTLDETQGWGWAQVIHPDDLADCLDAWHRSVETGVLYEVESRYRRAGDGVYRWHLGRACPLIDKQGIILKWFGTCTDIQDYKEGEAENVRLREELENRVHERTAELEHANVELQSSSRMLELSNGVLQDFASVAAHDLQEPLRKVQAFGDRLKLGYGQVLEEQGLDYLTRMLNATSRMQTLIQDLLAFSRVTSQGQAFVSIDLAAVARDVLCDLEERISETHATIEMGDLPVIEGDPVQIRQLLQNLIGNSIKFHKKDETPIIRLYTAVSGAGGEWYQLMVTDNGIGFDERYLDRIFCVFQRLHTRAEYEGTGVGLAICRKIAQRHGGEITATSVPNEGATFTVTLPRYVRSIRSSAARIYPE